MYILNASYITNTDKPFPDHHHYCRIELPTTLPEPELLRRAREITKALQVINPDIETTLTRWEHIGQTVDGFNHG